jgi:hypothetical protein
MEKASRYIFSVYALIDRANSSLVISAKATPPSRFVPSLYMTQNPRFRFPKNIFIKYFL